jgi:hypothetical protein
MLLGDSAQAVIQIGLRSFKNGIALLLLETGPRDLLFVLLAYTMSDSDTDGDGYAS